MNTSFVASLDLFLQDRSLLGVYVHPYQEVYFPVLDLYIIYYFDAEPQVLAKFHKNKTSPSPR